MAVTRAEVVQGLLSLYQDPQYLEVGVSEGLTFHQLTAARKVAVDPVFQFNLQEARAAQPNAEFHQVPSDAYFGGIVQADERFDVIYLDGLHTAEQTLRDLINAIQFLKPRGVIVIDDVVPASYVASLPDIRQFKHLKRVLGIAQKAWMGDVYKLVFFISSFCQQFTYRTVEDNHGQLVMWRQRRPSDAIPQRTLEEVGRTPYEQVILDRATFILRPYAAILDEVRNGLLGGSDGPLPLHQDAAPRSAQFSTAGARRVKS